jgi:hypothetical protein
MVLKRVGIEDARESALNGDAGSAARDFQVTKFEEPAGIKAKAQFDAEKQALVNHGEGIIQKTGGSLGLDEASLNTRGQVVAAPFDALGDWFTKKTGELYATAEERSQGMPNVQPASLEALLNDRSFKNQLTATNQGHVLQGVADELANFKETNPNGITVKNAEQFRQFLNTLWTKDTSKVIARMKDALDDDVFKSAGEDVFSDARKLYQQREATLSNPKGVARLMDTDPQTPINRVTAFDKIPDTLTKLSPDQFRNILETLDGMPAELQPLAAAAKAEIKAQLANRALEAGAKDKGAWNNKSVNKFIKDHSAKLAIAFEDQPELATSLRDMQAAGNILSYDQSYPGAAAQAANAMKRGLMSRSAGPALGTAGAATGGFLFGPGGAALGGGVGTMLGTKAGSAISEGAALKKWQGGVTRIADMPGVK